MPEENNDTPRPDQILLEKLKQLEQRFTDGLSEKFEQMDTSLRLASSEIEERRTHLTNLHRQLHTLAGSAGTFGFAHLGEHANLLEIALKGILDEETISPIRLLEFTGQLQEVLFWARRDPKGGNIAVVPERLPNVPESPTSVTKHDGSFQRLVLVLDDDLTLGQEIASQLEFFGYEAVVIVELGQLAAEVKKRMPAAIIIDMGFPAGGKAGALEVARIKQEIKINIPTVFISSDPGFDARMGAVRAGAACYFSKPVDLVALTDRLDVLTAHHKKQPYRILIVDDDACSAEYYGALLSNAGMEVKLLHEPQFILRDMAEYRPELVLMDVYMPTCSGIELAQLLRQDNLYLDIPIVYLSTERNYGKQLNALESGADDFLTKPIRPSHLLSSLTSRVERYRLLRDLIMRDSLTGLYKHSTIKEHLEREILRAQRNHSALTLAMLDLDHFKMVNDMYGHPVGDHVIRALSRLLQQRLRRIDIIGRYGGEEFAIIFPDTRIEDAFLVLDKLRLAFGKIRHHTTKGEFGVSFSAGMVQLRHNDDAKAMFSCADEALYQAKGNGRNQIQKEVRIKD